MRLTGPQKMHGRRQMCRVPGPTMPEAPTAPLAMSHQAPSTPNFSGLFSQRLTSADKLPGSSRVQKPLGEAGRRTCAGRGSSGGSGAPTRKPQDGSSTCQAGEAHHANRAFREAEGDKSCPGGLPSFSGGKGAWG